MGVTRAARPAAGWLGISRRTWRIVAWSLTVLLFLVAFAGVVEDGWDQWFDVAWKHLWVVGWLLLVTFRLRTTRALDVVSFFFIGFFPVVTVVVGVAEPIESLLGASSNLQTAFVVPLVEEVVKALPLLVWGLLTTRRGVHPTVTDLLLLGFAVGAGFAFHEDALWQRSTASGFEGPYGALFPTFFSGGAFVIAHAGWSLLAGAGIGLFLVHRRRPLAWILAAVPLGVAILDHMAVNWRGGGWFGSLLDRFTGSGLLAARLVLLSVVLAILHDVLVLRWTANRDRLFPPLPRERWAAPLATGLGPRQRLASLRALIRYLRYRNAVHADLYRLRSTGRSAGDRTQQVRYLSWLGDRAGVRWQPPQAAARDATAGDAATP